MIDWMDVSSNYLTIPGFFFELVLDGLAELERAVARSSDPERVEDDLAALVEALQMRGVTSLLLKETHKLIAADLDVSAGAIALLAENVLVLQQVVGQDRLYRLLSVLKMRFSAHDVLLHECTITAPAGIQVRSPFKRDPR